jgi:polar amino acid transport system permease protein
MIRDFTSNEFLAIVAGMQATIMLSLMAFVGGGLGGLAIALLRTAEFPWLRRAAAIFIDFFQGTPLLMQLFLVYYGLPAFGYRVNIWSPRAWG